MFERAKGKKTGEEGQANGRRIAEMGANAKPKHNRQQRGDGNTWAEKRARRAGPPVAGEKGKVSREEFDLQGAHAVEHIELGALLQGPA